MMVIVLVINPPGGTQLVQPFVGTNYFCESGNNNTDHAQILYTGTHYGMGRGVVHKRCAAVQHQGCHGFTETMVRQLQLTILSEGVWP